MLPACCVGLKRIWPEVAVTGDGWKVCKTFPPGERRSGAGPVEQGETEETARFLVFFLLVGDSLEEEPGEEDLEEDPLLALLAGLLCSIICCGAAGAGAGWIWRKF